MLISNSCRPQKAKPTTAGQPRPGGDGDADGLSDNASEVINPFLLFYDSHAICAWPVACTLLIKNGSLIMTISALLAVARARSFAAMAAFALFIYHVLIHLHMKRPRASGFVGIASSPNSNPRAWISRVPLTASLMVFSTRSSRSFKPKTPPVSLFREPSGRRSRTSGVMLAASTKRLYHRSPSKFTSQFTQINNLSSAGLVQQHST